MSESNPAPLGADEVPEGVDPTRPSPARMYDYFLGGTRNFEVDRAAASQIEQMVPELSSWAWGNRGFHQRAVRWLAGPDGPGIRQFLDLGSGLPTAHNTHEVASAITPEVSVVYVDVDPTAAAYAEALLRDSPRTAFISADLRRVEAVLGDPAATRLLDLSEPVGLMMTAVLHFVADADDPWAVVRRYLDVLPVGSHVAISHATVDGWPPEWIERVERIYQSATAQFHPRTRADVARLFESVTILPPFPGAEPEVVFGGVWGADDPTQADDDSSRWFYAAVGRKD